MERQGLHKANWPTGWPNKNRTFLRYHIFAATTDIIMRFLLKCSEITAENNKRHFFKPVLNILCKLAICYLVNINKRTNRPTNTTDRNTFRRGNYYQNVTRELQPNEFGLKNIGVHCSQYVTLRVTCQLRNQGMAIIQLKQNSTISHRGFIVPNENSICKTYSNSGIIKYTLN